MMDRRRWLVSAAGAAAAVLSGRGLSATSLREPQILVYKSPTCGCCSKWVEHMAGAGFETTVRDVEAIAGIKRDLGVPAALQSCHTALVDGYVLEGHVPADVALKLLREKPAAVGLAVPGMPMGSPGMEGPTRDRYDVILFGRDGSTRVYASR
jgi:hypothetical protein